MQGTHKKGPDQPALADSLIVDHYLSAGVLAPPPLIAPPARLPGGFKTPGEFLGAEPSPLGTEDSLGADGASGFELQPARKQHKSIARQSLRIRFLLSNQN